MPLDGREILLAGGSGGLGSVAARMLKTDGAKLIVSYFHNKVRAEKLSDIAQIVQADITKPADRERLLKSAPNLYGLVVMTGIPAREPKDWDRSLDVNYTGPIQLARQAAERMQANKMNGSIILMGTLQAVSGFPKANTTYAGAKAALIHAGRILAKDFRGPDEVRVNVVSPGTINAGMAEPSIASGKYDKYLKEGYIWRWGTAEDVARAIRFFLEPNNYITGQNILVDGGLGLGPGL